MATQGIVSVVVNGAVVCKAVAGCDGMEAPYLASLIAQERLTDPKEIHDLAECIGFGCDRCRVVQGPEGFAFGIDIGDEDFERYRRTFGDPRFNPRWEHGTADYVEVVEL